MSQEHAYFWTGVLLALFPVLILGGVGVWLGMKYWKEHKR